MTLIDTVKQLTEQECQSLDPDSDALPTLLYRDAESNQYVLGLAVDMNDDTAMLMTAHLILDEAIEAIYSGFVWSVVQDRDPDTDDGHYHGPMPSQHPDRVEQAMIVHYTPDGMAMYFAPVTRSPDAPPVLGEWENSPFTKMGGRIDRSLRMGLKISAGLPDGMRELFRQAKEQGDETRKAALRGVLRAMKEAVQEGAS